MQKNQDLKRFYTKDHSPYNGYYDEFAKRQSASPRTVMWNWSAFCFGPAWLAYRKAYGVALAVILAEYVISFVIGCIMGVACAYLFKSGPLPIWLMIFLANLLSLLVFMPLRGLFGNSLYFWDLRRRATAGSEKTGTSVPAALLTYVLVLALSIAIEALSIRYTAPVAIQPSPVSIQ